MERPAATPQGAAGATGSGGRLRAMQADGSRLAIHPSDVRGRFVRARTRVFAVLIAIYVGLPFWEVDGRPALHLDVEQRRFYLFGGTFNSQDVWLLLFVFTTVGVMLLLATAWLGRVWCGWACPQTVFLEGVYRRIERLLDGPRERRLRQASAPWTPGRLLRVGLKHLLYVAVSGVLAHVALSLFVSVGSLWQMLAEGPLRHPQAFGWTMAVTAALYFNFAWFREQLCILVCPYGRLQAAMQDKHSLTIGYDARRGEPRGRPRREAEEGARGDCVDCLRCVTVCPTGIDIRDGMQLECIACARCVDACDEVMARVGSQGGLIRYDSLVGLAGEVRPARRPRLWAYGALLLASAGALSWALATRVPFEVGLRRFQGAPYVLEGERVRNQLELQVVNKHPVQSTFSVRVEGPEGAEVLVPQKELRLGSMQSFRTPLFVTAPRTAGGPGGRISIEVEDSRSGEIRRLAIPFLAPPASL